MYMYVHVDLPCTYRKIFIKGDTLNIGRYPYSAYNNFVLCTFLAKRKCRF